jgi:hypothetical protein
MSSAPGPLDSGFRSGFAGSRPSAFEPSQPAAAGPHASARSGGVRYRHRPHALAAEREYSVGTQTLRWHDAAQTGRGTGQLAYAQIVAMRLETLPGSGATRRCRLTLLRRTGAPVVVDSDSAEGWWGRRSQGEAYRRFVRTLHAAALQVQPQLRLEAPPPPRLAGLGPALVALSTAVMLGVTKGPALALVGLALVWPLAHGVGRWQHSRRATALPRGALPRHLLP